MVGIGLSSSDLPCFGVLSILCVCVKGGGWGLVVEHHKGDPRGFSFHLYVKLVDRLPRVFLNPYWQV